MYFIVSFDNFWIAIRNFKKAIREKNYFYALTGLTAAVAGFLASLLSSRNNELEITFGREAEQDDDSGI